MKQNTVVVGIQIFNLLIITYYYMYRVGLMAELHGVNMDGTRVLYIVLLLVASSKADWANLQLFCNYTSES